MTPLAALQSDRVGPQLDYVGYYVSDHLPLWVRFRPKAVAAALRNG